MNDNKLQILIVDDDEDDYLITRDLLSEIEGSRFTWDWVSDWNKALDTINAGRHDVYLIDYHIGALTGLDLIKQAREHGCSAPLILLTGQSDKNVDFEATKIGAVDYLVKGKIDSDVLERSIRYSLEHTQVREALKASESRFRNLFDEAPIGYHELDAEGRITNINQTALRLLGYEMDDLKGQSIADFLIDRRASAESGQQCISFLELTSSGSIFEGSFRKKDGSLLPVLMEIKSLENHHGDVMGFRGTIQDNSEREAVQRLKDEFVSVLSHELRTPLTSIRASLGLLAEGIVGEMTDQAQNMLQIASRNTDRLVRLINDVLDIERIESGQITMERQICDAEDLMEQAAEAMKDLAKSSKVTLSVLAQPISIYSDPDRIVQVFTNLLGNAVKFSPEGGTVWLSVEQQEGQSIVFKVRDEGRGVPEDKFDSIFERFKQVDSSDSRDKGGTGLGLAICKSIVEQHGGRISVESTFGEGSTFAFTLPPSASGERTLIGGSPIPEGSAKSKRKILICDDEEAVLTVASAMLEQEGYEIVKSSSGQEALDKVLQTDPDAIMLDLGLSDMSGWDVLETLKSQSETRNIPVIIFSGMPSEENERLNLEIFGWVQKPWNYDALLNMLERATGEGNGHVPRVILVEDDEDLTRVMVTMFNTRGIEIIHARTGREAIRFSQVLTPDLIVLDVNVPDGDGFEVVKSLRQHSHLQGIPLVVHSSLDFTTEEKERLRLGATEFLTKGRVTPEEFGRRIVYMLNQVSSFKLTA